MQTAYNQFQKSLDYVKELDSLYVYLSDTLLLPNDLSDILRAEWIYAVSALDRFLHEIIKTGMIDIFNGTRNTTPKYLTFTISTDTLGKIINSNATSIPPAQYYFEQEIVQRHKLLSFQDPDKISDGLSFIWNNQHKWQTLSLALGVSESTLKTNLKSISTRRNQMVHEADMNPTTGNRNLIDKNDTDNVVSLIERLGEQIFLAVK